MRHENASSGLYLEPVKIEQLVGENGDYSPVLEFYGLDYNLKGFYWQIGEIPNRQGWIIHLSVIHVQIENLLHKLIPVLIREAVPFKLVQDQETAKEVLYGSLGYREMGKVIHIYPENDLKATDLAKKLAELTESFRGSDIPTDIPLKGIIYTRYACFTPVTLPSSEGDEEEYMYDRSGNLIKDSYSMPFRIPDGVSWPFIELASPVIPLPKKILNNIYKPLSVLKTDTRGNVVKGVYLKGLLRVSSCVIKIGKKNMIVDDAGRDIRDRLSWQWGLHQKLEGIIPLPKMIDFFEEEGDVYLVMEFIKGKNLYDRIIEINGGCKNFFQLPASEKSKLLDYLLKIISIVQQLHQRGYVHRDIAPGNFLIDHNDQIVVIDMELAYQLGEHKSLPPFELGTEGFMSPEQRMIMIPTVKEDIYGLGALMIVFFTGLSPVKFDMKDRPELIGSLKYFIPDPELANVIGRCLDYEPLNRPSLSFIQNMLEKHRQHWESEAFSEYCNKNNIQAEFKSLPETISLAIEGLSHWRMPISKKRWMSKTPNMDNRMGIIQKQYSAYPGLHTGMGGVLYLLFKARKIGFDISRTKQNYEASWEFIENDYLADKSDPDPSLYNGKAGIALVLAKGIEAGIIENSQSRRDQIAECLNMPNENLGLALGVSGQGFALLQCAAYLGSDIFQLLLQRFIKLIVNSQERDGSWSHLTEKGSKRKVLPIGLSHGISGIILFLLAGYSKKPDPGVLESIMKGLRYMIKKTHHGKKLFDQNGFRDVVGEYAETGDERTGFILACIKAYEIFKEPYFKQFAETVLEHYPEFVVNNNFSQAGGLSALGEVYCEAWRVFQNKEWKDRADRIAQVFIHTLFRKTDGGCYWLMEETSTPAADLMVGNSGIIHFLLRCYSADKVGYILIN